MDEDFRKRRTKEEAMTMRRMSAAIIPNLHLLSSPDRPCFFIQDQFLGTQRAHDVASEAQALQKGGKLRAAGMSRGGGHWTNEEYRGDEMIWLHVRGGGKEDSSSHSNTRPAIRHLLSQIEKMCRMIDAYDRENGSTLRLECHHKSAQLAYYPGNDKGYVRHCDAFPEDAGVSFRCLTCIYYLNDDWDESQGGQLRLHLGHDQKSKERVWDVEPIMDRLIVFRSDVIEHQVLPAHGPRYAITCWIHGQPIHTLRPPSTRPFPLASTLGLDQLGGSPSMRSPSKPSRLNGGEKEERDSSMTSSPPPLKVQVMAGEIESANIFVSIASYRDSECQHTLMNMYKTAMRPQRVFVGLVWQYWEEEDVECFSQALPSPWAKQVRTVKMSHKEAAGPCWARHLAQALWQGETFVLQIDSHMRFRPGWDAFLIEMLSRCPSEQPILTTYPTGYELPDLCSKDCRPTLLCPSRFDERGILRQRARRCKSIADEPLKSPLWASGFNFASSSVLEDVPYDPHLSHVFFGEEISMAARLWTHGYDFFAPPETVLYHLWSRSHRPSFREVKDLEKEAMEAKSLSRIRQLLGYVAGGEELQRSRYGLGNARKLEEYEALVGVSLKETKFMSPSAIWGGHVPEFFESSPSSAVGAGEEMNGCSSGRGGTSTLQALQALGLSNMVKRFLT